MILSYTGLVRADKLRRKNLGQETYFGYHCRHWDLFVVLKISPTLIYLASKPSSTRSFRCRFEHCDSAMGDFIMTMDDRSDASYDSDEGDNKIAFDFAVRLNNSESHILGLLRNSQELGLRMFL